MGWHKILPKLQPCLLIVAHYYATKMVWEGQWTWFVKTKLT
jgi:hypothetical protein